MTTKRSLNCCLMETMKTGTLIRCHMKIWNASMQVSELSATLGCQLLRQTMAERKEQQACAVNCLFLRVEGKDVCKL